MRQRRLIGFPILLILALLNVQHTSAAQGTNPQSDLANVDAQNAAGLSGTAQPASASEVIVRMDSSRHTVRRMLEEARSQRDVIKTLCLDDKLNQMDVALRAARDEKNKIESAFQKNDVDAANHEVMSLNVLRERTDQLVAEANLCISKETETVGAAASLLFVDPFIAEDPAYYPPGIIIIEPPPTGSVIK
jgi:hypothetical protein